MQKYASLMADQTGVGDSRTWQLGMPPLHTQPAIVSTKIDTSISSKLQLFYFHNLIR